MSDASEERILQLPTLVEILRARAERQPDRLSHRFLEEGEEETARLTYAELDRRARAIAHRLRRVAEPGDRVLLLYLPGLEFVAAFFGCLYGGVIAVPAYPPSRRPSTVQRLLAIVKDSGARVAATTSAMQPFLEAGASEHPGFAALRWVTTDDTAPGEEEGWHAALPATEDLALLQYTSGSTGLPKGVMVSHGNLRANRLYSRVNVDLSPETVSVTWLPSFHDMGLVDGVLNPVGLGYTSIILSPLSFLQRPARWLEAITRYGGTHGGGPNFGYDLCVRKVTPAERERLDLSTWTNAYNGAEPIRPEVIERFCEHFRSVGFRSSAMWPCYGLAEGTLMVTGNRTMNGPEYLEVEAAALAQHRVVTVAPGAAGGSRLVSSGITRLDTRVVIVDPATHQPRAPDRIGEIWISGPSVAQGYWNQPEATAETFGARLAPSGEGPFLRSGDLGFLHDGRLFVTGRHKDLIIIRGRNHYPQDIESTVQRAHPALRPGCGAAFSLELEGEERLAIVQEVDEEAREGLDVEAMATTIRQAVSEEHDLLVERVALIKARSIPKTSSGKIQRRATRQELLEGRLALLGESLRPRPRPAPADTESRRWLVERVSQMLDVAPEQLDPAESLARYGLDSLRAVSLAAELQARLGRPVPPTLAYEYASIDSLAGYMAGQGTAHSPSPEPRTASHEPIALIGLGCRFPGAAGPEDFWRLLEQGVDAISPVPPDRWDAEALHDERPQVPGKSRTRFGGFVEGIDLFDAELFGLSPREAEEMDPQQRLLLETAWEALEHAGLSPRALAGSSTGVFVGISGSDYFHRRAPDLSRISLYTGTGNALSIAANRLSYLLDLRGPSLAVDTACSSSLTALHLACRSLREGECRAALAAGVNVLLDPSLTVAFSQGNMTAPDGRCKTFDASADGYVRGEGCGVVLLKRLSDAERDGDRILALIRGSAINQDGRSNGLTAPNGLAQQDVLRRALDDAGVRPEEIRYVEAHGTGTSLGDPIEVAALQQVLGEGRPPEAPCQIGSVKTNIGHLEAAAGIAGVIKTVLALHHGRIPAHLHLRQLNPLIHLEGTPFRVPVTTMDWPPGRRLAGVSAFSFGGANAHVVLEAAPRPRDSAPEARAAHLLALSARDEASLRALAGRYAAFLAAHPECPLTDVCATAATGRAQLEERLAVVASTAKELSPRLEAFASGTEAMGPMRARARREPHRVVFLFTGQGSQRAGMGRELHASEPVFRAALERCAELMNPHLERPLTELLFGDSDEALRPTGVAQPALFALEWALAQQWRAWGVEPAAVLGHSVGELVAACVAGILRLEDGVRLVLERARRMQALPTGGGMRVVRAPAERVEAALAHQGGRVVVAAYNAPREVVVSGPLPALEELAQALDAEGIQSQALSVSHAFHSPLVEPMLEGLGQALQDVPLSPPRLPFLSNLTGRPVTTEPTEVGYWLRHCREPVRFSESLSWLLAQGFEAFLEVGPQPTLLAFGRHAETPTPEAQRLWLPSLRRHRPELAQMLESLSTLWAHGAVPGAAGPYAGTRHARVDLPRYPFQRRRFWSSAVGTDLASVSSSPVVDLLGRGDVAALARLVPREGALARVDRETLEAVLQSLAMLHRQGVPDSSSREASSTEALFHEVRWSRLPQRARPGPAGDGRRWLVLAHEPALATAVAAALEAHGRGALVVQASEHTRLEGSEPWRIDPSRDEDFPRLIARAQEEGPLEGVLCLWGAEPSGGPSPAVPGATETEAAQRRSVAGALHLSRALLEASGPTRPRLWLVTRGAVPAAGRMLASALPHASLWGFGRVLALEANELWGGLVDLDPSGPPAEAETLIDALLAGDGEDQVALRDGERHVARLAPLPRPTSRLTPHAEGLYLVTGGLGDVGLALARGLVEAGARRLLLVGRRAADERQRAEVQRLEALGARVETAQVDVADRAAVRELLRHVDEAGTPLRGIIHAAGVADDGTVSQQRWPRFQSVLAAKVAGSLHLHQETRGRPLDFFVLFSSAAAVLGSPGQSNYAAANAFLGALAHLRRAEGLPATAIAWGPWAGLGLARAGKDLERLAAMGVPSLSPEQALEAFLGLATGGPAEAAVLRLDLETPRRSAFARRPLLGDLAGGARPPPAPPSALLATLRRSPPARRLQLLTGFLQEQIREVLHREASAQVDVNQGFFELGMDSLMAIELKNRVELHLGVPLTASITFEHPSIRELSAYLSQRLSTDFPSAPPPPAEPSGAEADLSDEIERELGDLEKLLR